MKEEMIKITMPLIDGIELQNIDTFYNDIVDEYTKAYVKEKEQVIIQQIMKNLREENKSLQSQLKEKEEENEQLKADYGNLAQVERDLLKEVIKEAREHVNHSKKNIDESGMYVETYTKWKLVSDVLDDLLEILSKGENK